MTLDANGYLVSDALARSAATYTVDFNDWGIRMTPPPVTVTPVAAPNFQFPPVGENGLPSLAAIAIGPESTVDRCWTTWNRSQIFVVRPSLQSPINVSPPRQVSIGAPLLYAQLAASGMLSTTQDPGQAMQQGWLYAFPFSDGQAGKGYTTDALRGLTTAPPLNYISQFNTVLPFVDTHQGHVETPKLQLVLYLKTPAFSPPTVRSSMRRTLAWRGSGAHAPIASFPIYGRKHVRLQITPYPIFGVDGGATDFFVGFLRNVSESAAPPASFLDTSTFEVPKGSALAVPTGIATEFSFDNPCADYLLIYSSPSGGGTDRNGLLTMVAED